VLGDASAPVTVIEYASMTCVHCAHFAVNTFPVFKARYIDTGKVRFILREFPFDPAAAGAFMLARCGGNDQYFALIDLLFHTQATWAVQGALQPLFAVARQAGFTESGFKTCLTDQRLLDGIEWVKRRAVDKFRIDTTPTFFINGRRMKGALSIEEIERAIGVK